MRHLLRMIIEERGDWTFAVASHRPALIGKTIETVVTENEMVEQPDAQQVSSFTQTCGERPILGARRGIAGWMVVLCDVVTMKPRRSGRNPITRSSVNCQRCGGTPGI